MAGADGAAASHEIIVPLVMIRFRGQWSHIAVQNTDASQTATVTLDLLRTDSSLPVLTKSYLLAPGSPIWLDLRTNGAFIGIAPNTPDGFLGSMRISSAGEVAVHVVNDIEGSERGVHDYNGIPRAAGSPRLHIPLVVQGPGRDAAVFERTWLGVSNAGTIPAAVRVTYLGLDGPCSGQTFVQGPRVIVPLAMTMFDSTEAPGALPDGCLASATISSDGPNLAAAVVHLFEALPVAGEDVRDVNARRAAPSCRPVGRTASSPLIWTCSPRGSTARPSFAATRRFWCGCATRGAAAAWMRRFRPRCRWPSEAATTRHPIALSTRSSSRAAKARHPRHPRQPGPPLRRPRLYLRPSHR